MRHQSKVLRIDLLHDRLSDVFRRIQIAGEQLFIFKTYLEFAFEPHNLGAKLPFDIDTKTTDLVRVRHGLIGGPNCRLHHIRTLQFQQQKRSFLAAYWNVRA